MEAIKANVVDQALLLDLLNSTPIVEGMPRDELADRPAAMAWLRERDIAATDAEWEALVEARNILQAVVRGERSPADLAPMVAGVTYRPTATDAGLVWDRHVDDATDAAVRVILAWDALRVSSPGRLRPCANDDCRLFLIDRSKPNTARWCSMAICGNRMKARRHYNRARSATDSSTEVRS